MSAVAKVARRGFLLASAAVTGGVAFGVWAVRNPHANPLAAQAEDGEAVFNPWVTVTAQGITLIAPHADKGQGVFSTQAALIAEEMDLAWGDFDVSFGMPSPAYWNRALGSGAAPFLSRDHGSLPTLMRGVMTAAFKMLGGMGTGGSSSMPDSFIKLRAAGASARETLKRAAAKVHGVRVADLRTENSHVILPSGDAIPYTALAEAAADLPPVGEVALRDQSEWKLLGHDMLRLDIPPKSTGTLTYGIDVSVPGMKYAAVRTNPRQFGALRGYDASRAEAMRGVDRVVAVTGGVAVVADNTWRAFQALDAIDFDWGPAPYPAEQADHWREVAASFTEERFDQQYLDLGDVDAASIEGPTVDLEYRAGYVGHQPLEPLNAIVEVTDTGATVWAGHQLPTFLLQQVANTLEMEPDQVTFYNQFMGGSFGHRLEFGFVKQAAEIAIQMKGVPVKLTYTREEDFAHDFPRQITMARTRGVVSDGQVKSLDLSIASVSAVSSQGARIGFSIPGPDSEIVAGAWSQPYGLENFRVRAYRVPELAPTSSWRSVGASSSGFFADCSMDELLILAGQDPLEGRLAAMNYQPYRRVLERVGEMSNWGSKLGPEQGRGVSFVESFGVPVAMVVEVSNTPAGIRIDRVFTALDVGPVVDPVNFENLVQGGVVWGLGHAMNSEITYADGMAEQSNFNQHEAMRLYQCPEIMVSAVDNGSSIRGVGEPPVPAAPPALGNAIFDATGIRVRELPMNKHVDFL